MLELAPQLEQVIIANAQEKGVSVNQYLSNLVSPEPYLDSDLEVFKPNAEQAKFIQELLDNPPPPRPEIIALMNDYQEWCNETV